MGYVTLIRRNVFEGHCLVDYLRFPFDRQICKIQFSLERYFDPSSDPGFDVALVERDESESGGLFEWFENEQWDLEKVTQETRNYTFRKSQPESQKQELRPNNNETFMIGFVVNITLRRHSQFYVVNILIPILVLTALECHGADRLRGARSRRCEDRRAAHSSARLHVRAGLCGHRVAAIRRVFAARRVHSRMRIAYLCKLPHVFNLHVALIERPPGVSASLTYHSARLVLSASA